VGLFQDIASLTRFPIVYRLWQAPFVRDKLAPLLQRGELASARRVLDVGCGPGTNAPQFNHADYVGIDISERYIETARRRYRGTFQTADVRSYQPPPGEQFDFVLVNSLLHHLETAAVFRILQCVHDLLADGGHVHILELVLPERYCVAQMLARADRGDYPRSLKAWRQLFGDVFDEVVFEPYSVRRCGVALWNMVYFKGRARGAPSPPASSDPPLH
jgi:SAM-dependent methyltransferase